MLEPDAPRPEEPPRPLHHRLLALLALVALLVSAVWSSCAILTDRANFGAERIDAPNAEGSTDAP